MQTVAADRRKSRRAGWGEPMRVAVVAAIAMLASVASGVRADEDPYDLWYVLEIDGARAGWYHERVEIDADLITTTSDTSMSIRRGADTVTIDIRSRFVETERYEPRRWETSVAMGSAPIDRVFVFGDDGVQIKTTQGGRSTTRRADLPEGDWLTPAGIRALGPGWTSQ